MLLFPEVNVYSTEVNVILCKVKVNVSEGIVTFLR